MPLHRSFVSMFVALWLGGSGACRLGGGSPIGEGVEGEIYVS